MGELQTSSQQHPRVRRRPGSAAETDIRARARPMKRRPIQRAQIARGRTPVRRIVANTFVRHQIDRELPHPIAQVHGDVTPNRNVLDVRQAPPVAAQLEDDLVAAGAQVVHGHQVLRDVVDNAALGVADLAANARGHTPHALISHAFTSRRAVN